MKEGGHLQIADQCVFTVHSIQRIGLTMEYTFYLIVCQKANYDNKVLMAWMLTGPENATAQS